MIALQVSSMKSFMNHLLVADTFDMFLLEEAVVGMACTYHIDGHTNREFFQNGNPEEELPAHPEPDLRPWRDLKGLCYNLIKGKRTPLHFRFVMHLLPEKATALLVKNGCDVDPSLVRALVLNIRYDGSKAVLTTGTAYQTFVPSKEPDIIWDKALAKYLDGKGIACESL